MAKRLKYIGKQPMKKDNVCNTAITWAYRGAVCSVPDEIAPRLLAHSDVWVEADPDDKGEPMEDDKTALLETAINPATGAPATREDKLIACVQVINELDGWDYVDTYRNSIPKIPEPEETESQPVFSMDKEEAIVQAIMVMDRDNELQFTAQGIPRVEALEKLLGYPITAEQRSEAWAKIEESEAGLS